MRKRQGGEASGGGQRIDQSLHRRSLDFIERNKEGPFFLYLSHTMLHAPLGVSEEFKELPSGANTAMPFRNSITTLVECLIRLND